MSSGSSPSPTDIWKTSRFDIPLHHPVVMGIVNVTPDSFSNPTPPRTVSDAIDCAAALLKEGAHVLDIGGESTRPGATPLTPEEEWQRVELVLKEVLRWQVPISLDTYHPANMHKALDLGVDIINDIWGFRQVGAMEAVASYRCGLCMMHMQGEPATMQLQPIEASVMTALATFFTDRLARANAMAIEPQRIVIDPGIGFGKSVSQNFAILNAQQALLDLGQPIMVGWSRKSSLGVVTGLSVEQRLIPSVAAALIALERGASVLRVHDVAQTQAAVSVWLASRPTA